MTKEEFENRTLKEIVAECRKTDKCLECPYTGVEYVCLFNNVPQEWIKDYMKKQNKVLS